MKRPLSLVSYLIRQYSLPHEVMGKRVNEINDLIQNASWSGEINGSLAEELLSALALIEQYPNLVDELENMSLDIKYRTTDEWKKVTTVFSEYMKNNSVKET